MEKVNAKDAPAAVGPYSHAVIADQLVFCSGQIPLDPTSMELVGHNIEEQTLQVFKNIRSVLDSIGLSLDNVVKTTVFLKNMDDFKDMNSTYEKSFGNHKPARSAVEVSKLPLNALVEIECIARMKK